MIDKKTAENILKIYEDAWVNQNPEKIISIFTEDGVYHEKVLEKPFIGHEQIKQYWQSKVVEEQSDINFKLLNYYIDGDTIIAEWDASFYSNEKKARIHIIEVAIMEISENKIRSLREYWQSEVLPPSTN
jgi:nuclear transport factor 2 (NTF2) superfamily protein